MQKYENNWQKKDFYDFLVGKYWIDFSGNYNFEVKIWENPILQNLGIFLEAEATWQNIYNFLLKIKTKKEKYHEAKNNEKIYNKWFDLKTSFRPKMKKNK